MLQSKRQGGKAGWVVFAVGLFTQMARRVYNTTAAVVLHCAAAEHWL
jgi:hypothetical protein